MQAREVTAAEAHVGSVWSRSGLCEGLQWGSEGVVQAREVTAAEAHVGSVWSRESRDGPESPDSLES